MQEALVRAWRRRDACRTPDAPLPWLLEITRNEARRLLERRTRGTHLAVAGAALAKADGEDETLTQTTDRLSVEQALARLELADSCVLRLRYAEDLTQAEVARRLGLPEGTAKVRLHRARRRLRALLEEEA